jgi:integrase
MTPKVLWEVIRAAATRAGIEKLAPHDLRRSCARLCHLAGGELDQIQFLLGHVSIQTRNATSAANRNCALPSMIEWALNRIMRRIRGDADEPWANPWRLCANNPAPVGIRFTNN